VPDNDYAFRIDDDWLATPKLLQAGGDGVDGQIVLPRIAVVGFEPFDGPEIDLHVGSGSPIRVSRRPTGC
jgi:hypothetical protein